eukprot:TRINITY_DN4362_c0_g1_i3.p1 TRINITY_DN4362_c0_g1~~TRINITY_DN4362_c0_g1_i3.p1  ORF type:complete len:546 (-),score=123.05 TRINITY_DN4362_c0_g1_i3:550-2187(-)
MEVAKPSSIEDAAVFVSTGEDSSPARSRVVTEVYSLSDGDDDSADDIAELGVRPSGARVTSPRSRLSYMFERNDLLNDGLASFARVFTHNMTARGSAAEKKRRSRSSVLLRDESEEVVLDLATENARLRQQLRELHAQVQSPFFPRNIELRQSCSSMTGLVSPGLSQTDASTTASSTATAGPGDPPTCNASAASGDVGSAAGGEATQGEVANGAAGTRESDSDTIIALAAALSPRSVQSEKRVSGSQRRSSSQRDSRLDSPNMVAHQLQAQRLQLKTEKERRRQLEIECQELRRQLRKTERKVALLSKELDDAVPGRSAAVVGAASSSSAFKAAASGGTSAWGRAISAVAGKKEKEYYVDIRPVADIAVGTKGIGYRLSKEMGDVDTSRQAAWGSIVKGVDTGDGWLKVGSHYLPMRLRGKQVLVVQHKGNLLSNLNYAVSGFLDGIGLSSEVEVEKSVTGRSDVFDCDEDTALCWDSRHLSENLELSEDGLTVGFAAEHKSALLAYAVTAQSPTAADGFSFSVRVVKVRSGEQDGLAIGFTSIP